MDNNFNLFGEIKKNLLDELRYVCPKITPVNNVGIKVTYTIYWNGNYKDAVFKLKPSDDFYETITLTQEICFCISREMMSLDIVADEMTKEIMKKYGGNRFSYSVNILENDKDENNESENDESEGDDVLNCVLEFI